MSKRLHVAITLLLGLLLVAGARANQLEFKADPESARRGVGQYLVERSVNNLTISVLDPKGVELQTISAALGSPEGARMQVKAGEEDLLVILDFEMGRLSVTDNATGESVAATLRRGQPLLIEGSKSFLDEHSHTVSMAVVAYEQNLINLGIRRPPSPQTLPQCSTQFFGLEGWRRL
jgi:hypothetical protein